MKKLIFLVSLAILGILNFQGLKAQCSNGNTQNAMDTYWHYRYRFTNYFTQVGEGTWDNYWGGFGQSIPCYIRNQSQSTTDNGCYQYLWYSDVGRNLGYYIGTLATEYYLLYQYNVNNPTLPQNNLNETAMELFYALHAVFRLDSLGLYQWCYVAQQSIKSTIIPNFQSANPVAIFPGYGYMIQDDVPGDFYNKVGSASSLPDYVTNGIGYGQIGSGTVGPVSGINSSWVGSSNTYKDGTSQDNYYGILMGLSLTVELLKNLPAVNSFYDGNITVNIGTVYPSYGNLCSMAQGLGTSILQYIFNCNYILQYPDGSGIPNIGCATAYCEPLKEINSSFFSATPPSNDCPVSICSFFSGWGDASHLCDIADFTGCPPSSANIEMACELAAMSNDGSRYGSAQACISALGNYPHDIGCLLCNDVSPNNYGEDLLFEAVNQILYPTNNNFGAYVNLCEMQDILNSAPYDGPYKHSDGTSGNPPFDCAACSWAAPNRFIWGPSVPDGTGGYSGNFNGLDYMLFYNLYCIMAEWQNSYLSPVTIPSCTSCLSNFPGFENCNFPATAGGFNTSPYTFQSPYCTPIYVNNLDVGSTGGFVIQGGSNSFIDLNPTSGNIIVNSGGYFDASCPINCCEIASNSYIFESDPGSSSDRCPITKTDSTATYQITSSFALKPNYDAIIAYPNPFNTNTTFEFAIKETTPVTISIYDMSGQKVKDVFVSQTYTQGNYAQNFDGTSLASGNYIAVMTTKDDKKTVKTIKN